jgi:2-oxoglutarate dehydrogenase E2 component (dihydrolipoamide succinyltransferase)
MKIEIKVPAMGESISEATIGTFLKPNGAYVNADEELVELETDKVNQVLYAPQAGTLSWSVSQGDHVKIQQVIGSVDSDQKAPSAQKVQKAQDSSAKQAEPPKSIPQPQKKAEEPVLQATTNKPKESASTSVRSTKENFLSELTFSTSSSDTKQLPSQMSTPEKALPSLASVERETRKPMSKIRKVIATRLVDVIQQTAMLTTFNEVDMTKIMGLRDTYKETFSKKYNVRLGFMSFFVKAVVSALKAFPEVNAYIDGDDLISRHYYDISIAVGTEKGLFVPVVRNCDALSFADIERSIESYALKAKEGKLSPADLQGGCFTITNGGTYGSLLSTPILNPPQSAILGMHKIMKRAVVVDDEIVIRQMMYLALSYDHRVIDGKEAVSFLVHIKNALEDPDRLLIGL